MRQTADENLPTQKFLTSKLQGAEYVTEGVQRTFVCIATMI